jgi:hypothetical protein
MVDIHLQVEMYEGSIHMVDIHDHASLDNFLAWISPIYIKTIIYVYCKILNISDILYPSISVGCFLHGRTFL